MLDRMSLSARSGWFDSENRVYIKYGLKSIMEDLNCSKMTAVGLLKELSGIGLIDMEQKSGMANIIYVKNFISENKAASLDQSKKCTSKKSEPVEVDESTDETGTEISPVHFEDQSEDMTSTGTEAVPGVVQNLDPNNKELNNKELSDNYPISQSADFASGSEMDAMDEAEGYMAIIRENLDYDILMSSPNWRNREMFEELYQLICEVVCVPRKTIRIAGEDYPYSLVKSKFLKLRSHHLEYVIDCIEHNTTKVANIKAYLITALYNAPNTISHYYTAEVNHDMYGV